MYIDLEGERISNQVDRNRLLAIGKRQAVLYMYIYIYVDDYSISHLLGKPQGPLLFCSVVGVVVAGALGSEPCCVPGVVPLA